jgi:dimeric dUTPase (all-alpha-NTP-PPase superfamily)
MKIEEQLKEMFTMQKALNEAILKEFGQDSMTEEKLQLAIIDELGELTHELKGDWCWWKKTQKPVDRKRVLEELVDVYHFVMIWEMFKRVEYKIEYILKAYAIEILMFGTNVENETLDYIICRMELDKHKLDWLLKLTEQLGFSFDEVYQEYINKNRENYDRLARGY